MVRSSLTLTTLIVSACGAAAWAQDSGVSARLAPPSDLGVAIPRCKAPICGLVLPQDLWKRDVLSKFNEETLNENAIVRDRNRRSELDRRFTETPKLEIRIGNTSCFATLEAASVSTGTGDVGVLRLLSCGF